MNKLTVVNLRTDSDRTKSNLLCSLCHINLVAGRFNYSVVFPSFRWPLRAHGLFAGVTEVCGASEIRSAVILHYRYELTFYVQLDTK